MADLSKLTLDELRAQFVELGDQLSVIAETRCAVLAEIKTRESRAAASASLDTLNANDKVNLFDVLKSDPDVAEAALANDLSQVVTKA